MDNPSHHARGVGQGLRLKTGTISNRGVNVAVAGWKYPTPTSTPAPALTSLLSPKEQEAGCGTESFAGGDAKTSGRLQQIGIRKSRDIA